MQGDLKSAETHLRTALAVRPDFVDALIALGKPLRCGRPPRRGRAVPAFGDCASP
jgi:hypothetical protein